MSAVTPFLTDDEVAMLCTPLTQPAAIRRFLTRLGVPFRIRPDGRPIVSRRQADDLFSSPPGGSTAAQKETEPNRAAIMARFSKRARSEGVQ